VSDGVDVMVAQGQYDQAAAAWREVIMACRGAVARNPNVLDGVLGASLNGLAEVLAGGGRHAESIAVRQEEIGIWQRCAAWRGGADAYDAELSASLLQQGDSMWAVGQRVAALVTLQEALVHARRAAAASPSLKADIKLAMRLGDVASRLKEGKRELDAVALLREAVALAQAHEAREPGRHARFVAVMSLNIPAYLALAGRAEEAVAASRETVRLTKLAVAAPAAGDDRIDSLLRDTQSMLGGLLMQQAGLLTAAAAEQADRIDDARQASAAAAAAGAPSAGRGGPEPDQEDNPMVDGTMATAAATAAAGAAGELLRERQATLAEAVAVYAAAAAANPQLTPKWVSALRRQASAAAEIRDAATAFNALRMATGVLRSICERQAADFGADLAETIEERVTLLERGLVDAEAAEAAPASAGDADEVAVGEMLALLGEAAKWYEKAGVRAHAAALANTLKRLAALQKDVGDEAAALASYKAAIALVRGLPAEQRVQRGVARLQEDYGNALADAGQAAAAVAMLRDAVATRRQLEASQPGQHVPELDHALTSLVLALLAAGRARDAVAPARESVELSRRMMEAAPADPEERESLGIALKNLATALDRSGQAEAAVAIATEAVALHRQPQQQAPGGDASALPDALDQLARLHVARGGAASLRAAVAAADEAAVLRRSRMVPSTRGSVARDAVAAAGSYIAAGQLAQAAAALRTVITTREAYLCDVCRDEFPVGSTRWRCGREGDACATFDLCKYCHAANTSDSDPAHGTLHPVDHILTPFVIAAPPAAPAPRKNVFAGCVIA
jgi:hypothetical protein